MIVTLLLFCTILVVWLLVFKGVCRVRLDKYLKASRVIKRRTIANEACDAGRVFVNGRAQRASYEVKLGDEIELAMGSKTFKLRVTGLSEHTNKQNASENFEII